MLWQQVLTRLTVSVRKSSLASTFGSKYNCKLWQTYPNLRRCCSVICKQAVAKVDLCFMPLGQKSSLVNHRNAWRPIPTNFKRRGNFTANTRDVSLLSLFCAFFFLSIFYHAVIPKWSTFVGEHAGIFRNLLAQVGILHVVNQKDCILGSISYHYLLFWRKMFWQVSISEVDISLSIPIESLYDIAWLEN